MNTSNQSMTDSEDEVFLGPVTDKERRQIKERGLDALNETICMPQNSNLESNSDCDESSEKFDDSNEIFLNSTKSKDIDHVSSDEFDHNISSSSKSDEYVLSKSKSDELYHNCSSSSKSEEYVHIWSSAKSEDSNVSSSAKSEEFDQKIVSVTKPEELEYNELSALHFEEQHEAYGSKSEYSGNTENSGMNVADTPLDNSVSTDTESEFECDISKVVKQLEFSDNDTENPVIDTENESSGLYSEEQHNESCVSQSENSATTENSGMNVHELEKPLDTSASTSTESEFDREISRIAKQLKFSDINTQNQSMRFHCEEQYESCVSKSENIATTEYTGRHVAYLHKILDTSPNTSTESELKRDTNRVVKQLKFSDIDMEKPDSTFMTEDQYLEKELDLSRNGVHLESLKICPHSCEKLSPVTAMLAYDETGQRREFNDTVEEIDFMMAMAEKLEAGEFPQQENKENEVGTNTESSVCSTQVSAVLNTQDTDLTTMSTNTSEISTPQNKKLLPPVYLCSEFSTPSAVEFKRPPVSAKYTKYYTPQGIISPRSIDSTKKTPLKRTVAYDNIVSPVAMYIHNRPVPPVIRNIKTTPIGKGLVPRPADQPRNFFQKQNSEVPRPGVQPRNFFQKQNSELCMLPQVNYELSKVSSDNFRTLTPPLPPKGKIAKLMGSPIEVVRHMGRVRVPACQATSMKGLGDSTMNEIMDSSSFEISVLETNPVCRSKTMPSFSIKDKGK